MARKKRLVEMDPIKPDQKIRAGCAPPPFLPGARKKNLVLK